MHYFRKPIILLFIFFLVIAGCDSKNNTPVKIPDTSDIPAAYKHLIDDARVGRGNAQMIFAEMYDKGADAPRDINKSIAWYNIAIANNSKNIDAYYNVALLYLEKKELKNSIDMFEKAAALGDVEAENQLAQIYSDNQNLDDNYKKVIYWRESAASKGDKLALSILAAMYHVGQGVEKNKKKAHVVFLKAATAGDVDSMYFVGKDFYEGTLVEKNIVDAYKWIKRSINDSKFGSDMELLAERNKELKNIEKELTPEQIAAVNKELGITD